MGLIHNCEAIQVFVSSTTHVRKLAARANRKFRFYGMWPEFWGYSLYSKPMEEVSYLNYEYRYWFVAEICFTI